MFSLRGPVGLGNDKVGLQYFKIDIMIEELKFAVRFMESHTFNSHHMREYSKTLIVKILPMHIKCYTKKLKESPKTCLANHIG